MLESATECAADVKGSKVVCSNRSELHAMRKFLVMSGLREDAVKKLCDKRIVLAVTKLLDVNKESEIYSNPKFRRYFGSQPADIALQENFVPPGPANSTALLDNFNIDATLAQWAQHSQDEFDKKFYHIPFQMIDFAQYNTELAKFDMHNVKTAGYSCFGVVLNTDISTGRGKHWFCLYGQFNKGTKENPHTLEYFNSSGFPPMLEILAFLDKACHDMIRDHGEYCEIIYATGGHRLQHSKTECGMWSLIYILSRLLDKPHNWMLAAKINDQDMIKFRKKLFR